MRFRDLRAGKLVAMAPFVMSGMKRRSEALGILELHICTAPHPLNAVGWRSFQTLGLRRATTSPRF